MNATDERLTTNRRTFLAGSVGVLAATSLGPRLAFATPTDPALGDTLVVVFLRGGMDGLSMVAPTQMSTYRALRPNLRVKDASEVADPANGGLPLHAGGSIPPFALDGVFSFHPGMAALHASAWLDGNLAIVHAAGMPASESATRSHFEAMRYWESGTAAPGGQSRGFLNRMLEGVPHGTLGGVGRGSALAFSLAGPEPTYSMNSIAGFGVKNFSNNALAKSVLQSWYDPNGSLGMEQLGARTLGAVGEVAAINWASSAYAVQNGAQYPNTGFGRDLREVAQLVRSSVGLRAAAIDLGGWDTHSGVGAPEDPASYFRRMCANLSDGLAAFYRDLGSQMNEVTVLVMSEFGRTINENSTGGTDHGRGSALMVMGGGVNGGVHGPFVPQIENGPEDDLAVLTDYRTVVAEVLTSRCGLSNASQVFPSWTPTAPLGLCSS